METEKKQKRIVSKTALLHMKLRLGSLISIFTLAGTVFGTIAAVCFLFVLNQAFNHFVDRGLAGLWWFFGMIGFAFAFITYRTGETTKEHCQELLDLKTLYTAVNTADLPAVDSLVRASEKPEQAQADVLLRAAADVQQIAPEQLLRSTTGEEVRS